MLIKIVSKCVNSRDIVHLKKTEEPEGNAPSLEALDTAPLHAVGEVDDVTTSFLSYHPVRGGEGLFISSVEQQKQREKMYHRPR